MTEGKATIAAFFLVGLLIAFCSFDVVMKFKTGQCTHDRMMDRYGSYESG